MSDLPIFDESGRPVGDTRASVPAPVAADATSGDDGPPAFDPMSMDEARALMVREHGVAVSKDDPILLAVTLHRAFCRDLEKLLAIRERQSLGMLTEAANAVAETVEATIAALKDKAIQAGIQNALAMIAEQAKHQERLEATMRRHRRWLAAYTAVSIVAGVVSVAILFLMLR